MNYIKIIIIVLMLSDSYLFSDINDTASITLSVYSEDPSPEFYFIFSKNTMTDINCNNLNLISKDDLNKLIIKNDKNILIIKTGGKRSFNASYFNYYFGPGEDENKPWNNGETFNRNSRENMSDELWDNICIIYVPSKDFAGSTEPKTMIIKNAVIKRNNLILFDSSLKDSYPNKYKFTTVMPELNLYSSNDLHPVLNLTQLMHEFKINYFEIKSSILQTAYSDLAQTDRSKYTDAGNAWCSEFASFNYRINGIMTPDPFIMDIGASALLDFFTKNGNVYALREIAGWDNEKKKKLIMPGSIICRDGHTFLFTSWVLSDEKIFKFSSISGNNTSGGIRYHSLIDLPDIKSFENLPKEKLQEYDKANFIAVPDTRPQNMPYSINGTISLPDNIIAHENIILFINAQNNDGGTYSAKITIDKGQSKIPYSIKAPAGKYILNIWNYEKNQYARNVYYPQGPSSEKYISVTNGNLTGIDLFLQKELNTVKIKNLLTGAYLYENEGKAMTGRENGEQYLWIIEKAGDGYIKIKNKKTGNYLHIEHQYDYIECDNTVQSGWYSARWLLIKNQNGTYYIQNRWKTDNYIHICGNKSFAEHKKPNMTNNASLWIIEEQ